MMTYRFIAYPPVRTTLWAVYDVLFVFLSAPSRPLPSPPVPVSTQAGQERLFKSLTASELNLYLDLRPYMQRVPYIIPATASLSRTYRLFR